MGHNHTAAGAAGASVCIASAMQFLLFHLLWDIEYVNWTNADSIIEFISSNFRFQFQQQQLESFASCISCSRFWMWVEKIIIILILRNIAAAAEKIMTRWHFVSRTLSCLVFVLPIALPVPAAACLGQWMNWFCKHAWKIQRKVTNAFTSMRLGNFTVEFAS